MSQLQASTFTYVAWYEIRRDAFTGFARKAELAESSASVRRKNERAENAAVAHQAVDTAATLRIISLYQELPTDTTFELRLKPSMTPVGDNQVQPTAQIGLQLNTGDRSFEPNDAKARILLVKE